MLVSNPSRDPGPLVSVILSFISCIFPFRLFRFSMLAFASFWRGQPPAWRTKVVDDDLRPLKSGPPCLSVPVCANDAASPKPTTPGRDVADVHAQTACGCVVSACGSVHCKTCRHISQGSIYLH